MSAAGHPPTTVFVDFDGTVTDIDTFDLLVRHAAGEEAWDELDGALVAREITLREALRRQALLVRYSLDEALEVLASATVDPSFAPFVAASRAAGIEVVIVSAGIGTIVRATLARHGLADVPVYANDVDFAPSGWNMAFLDASDNGHDKAARVRAAQAAGVHTVYCGDGISDEEAALVAERRFAKRGKALERYLLERGVPFTSFDAFAEIVPPFDASFPSM